MAIKNGGNNVCYVFKNYISAGYPLLWVTTHEEQRALTCLASEAASCATQRRIYGWTCVDGVHQYTVSKGALTQSPPVMAPHPEDKDQTISLIDMNIMFQWADKLMPDNSILVLKDFHNFLIKDSNTAINGTRWIRNLLGAFKAKGKMVILMSPTTAIPLELDKEITPVQFKLPSREELKTVLQSVCTDAGVKYPPDEEAASIIEASAGLTASEAENAISLSLAENKGKFDQDVISREKALIVKKGHLLEIVNTNLDLKDIGGLDRIKEWLMENENTNTEAASKFGITPAKGMLLLGVPGTGKSLTAKAISKIWHRPLLKLDIANIFQGVVGGSESNMTNALATAAACAPCVLFIDELEKAFAGTGAGDYTGDSGTAKRLFGTFLSWMQDREADVFIVATANSVVNLGTEFLRAQRFDVVFWVDIPTQKEREQILRIHISRKGHDPDKVDVKAAAASCKGFTGAEIETLVQYALKRAFKDNRDIKTEDFTKSVGRITPVIRLRGADILKDRMQAEKNGVISASSEKEVEDIPVPVDETQATGRKISIEKGPSVN